MKNLTLALTFLTAVSASAAGSVIRCDLRENDLVNSKPLDICYLGNLDVLEGKKARGKARVTSCQLFTSKSAVTTRLHLNEDATEILIVAPNGIREVLKDAQGDFRTEVHFASLGNDKRVTCGRLAGSTNRHLILK